MHRQVSVVIDSCTQPRPSFDERDFKSCPGEAVRCDSTAGTAADDAHVKNTGCHGITFLGGSLYHIPVRVSIIIPTLNEESCIAKTLSAACMLRPFEIIVADGGSTDRTIDIAREFCRVVHCAEGRGLQQKIGAEAAAGDVLWFLHADTVPDRGALDAIVGGLSDTAVAGGNFSLQFDGEGRSSRQLTLIYPRLRLLGLRYGDSGIFVRRSAYEAVGGFRPYPLFEDLDLVRRIKNAGVFRTLPETLRTSSRRFEGRNFAMMFAVWSALQVLYWAGISPHRLAEFYKPIRRDHARAG
jgi:rSAM/selenodomain-associated transferase 2